MFFLFDKNSEKLMLRTGLFRRFAVALPKKKSELETRIRALSDLYHNGKESGVSDAEYDALVASLAKKSPKKKNSNLVIFFFVLLFMMLK